MMMQSLGDVAQKIAGAVKGLVSRPGDAPSQEDVAKLVMQWGFGGHDEAVRFVDDEYARRLAENRPWHLQWRLNIDYENSHQYRYVDPVSGEIRDTIKTHWWETRRVHNQILPTKVVRTAKLSRARVVLKARPASSEDRDVGTAKTSWRVLSANEQDQDWPSKYMDLLTWLDSCGTVITKTVFNRNLGRLLPGQQPPQQTEGEGAPVAAESGESQPGAALKEGDVETLVRSPFGILPDSPWRSDPNQCRSIMEAMALPVEEITATYGVTVQAEDVTALGTQRNIVAPGAPGAGTGTAARIAPVKMEGHAVVKELWELPTAKYPDGRFIVVANKKLLHIGPLPYKCGPNGSYGYPYTFWWSIRVTGCLWGKSVHELLIPLQDEWNELQNDKTAFRRRVAKGQWRVEKGSVDLAEFAENVGADDYIIEYERGASRMPEPVQASDRPSMFDRDEASILNEWAIISGISDVTRKSEAPPGVKSGVALSIAVEQDDTRLAATVENIANAAVREGKVRIRLYRQFATTKRMSRYVGPDNQVDVFYWAGSDLTSDDLFVENSSALAESPAQRRQMVFDLMGQGFFNDPETGKMTRAGRAKLMEMLALGNWEDGTDMDALQVAKQDRELQRMLNGMPVTVSPIDDDLIHLSRLTRFMLTADYEERIGGPNGAQLQALYEQHFEDHVNQMASKMVQSGEVQSQPMGAQPA